jgi:hypothetical protein
MNPLRRLHVYFDLRHGLLKSFNAFSSCHHESPGNGSLNKPWQEIIRPSCLSFGPSIALQLPAHILICTSGCAL